MTVVTLGSTMGYRISTCTGNSATQSKWLCASMKPQAGGIQAPFGVAGHEVLGCGCLGQDHGRNAVSLHQDMPGKGACPVPSINDAIDNQEGRHILSSFSAIVKETKLEDKVILIECAKIQSPSPEDSGWILWGLSGII